MYQAPRHELSFGSSARAAPLKPETPAPVRQRSDRLRDFCKAKAEILSFGEPMSTDNVFFPMPKEK